MAEDKKRCAEISPRVQEVFRQMNDILSGRTTPVVPHAPEVEKPAKASSVPQQVAPQSKLSPRVLEIFQQMRDALNTPQI